MANCHSLPHLNTDFTGPLHFLEKHFLSHHQAIESWFGAQWRLTRPPVYGSVDLRNAGFKVSPIDMNLFPAGFNNLGAKSFAISQSAARDIILALAPGAKKILVVPESHTRNLNYWENMYVLQSLLEKAGFDVRLGAWSESIHSPQSIGLASGNHVIVRPLLRIDDRLCVKDFVPDLVLLNNDLSEGIPDILRNIKQPIMPPPELGWSQRLKSTHFQRYADVVQEFAQYIDIDPWLVSPMFRFCGQIDFMQQEGTACVVNHARELFAAIQKQYDYYHVPLRPFLVVKADAGTYGMAVMTVRNIEELASLNRKQRTKMSITKGGQPVRRVIIQEGVYTCETIGHERAVAEPVLYLWGHTVVGGFYRLHKGRNVDENLNAPGMEFQPIVFSPSCHNPNEHVALNGFQSRFYVYGLIAQLSMLAAAREISALTQQMHGGPET